MVSRPQAWSTCLVRVWLAIAFLLASLTASSAHAAQSDLQASEASVKAVFLFKFADYVEWPDGAFATAQSPFTIGVLEADGLASELATVAAGRSIGGRPVVVRELHRGDALGDLNVLFVGGATGAAVAQVLEQLRGRPTLTVTESRDSAGGMINFVVVDGRVRFDVALRPVESNSLKISSRLLAVARKVERP